MSAPTHEGIERVLGQEMNENDSSIEKLSVNLANQIEEHVKKTGERFHKMVLIPRGSYAVGNIVSRRLGFRAPHMLHMGMTTYPDGLTVAQDEFEYGQMPTREEVEGLNLLIIEEVCDTGNTMQHASDLLKLAGANVLRFGALHYKPDMTTTGFVPDFYGAVTDGWIHYPWERHEEIGASSSVRISTDEEITRIGARKMTVDMRPADGVQLL